MRTENEVFICKVKECSMMFMSELIKAAERHVKAHYPKHEGQIRNAADGTYELFAIPKTENKKP